MPCTSGMSSLEARGKDSALSMTVNVVAMAAITAGEHLLLAMYSCLLARYLLETASE